MLRGGWNRFARNGLDRGTIPKRPDLAWIVRQLETGGHQHAAFFFRAIQLLEYRGTGGANRRNDGLARNLDSGLQNGLLGSGGHQTVVQNDFDAPLLQDLLREQSQWIGHFGKDTRARMNQHAAHRFIAQPHVVLLHAMNEVIQLRDHFDARESAAPHHDGQYLPAHIRIVFDVGFFQYVDHVIPDRDCDR
jgi:hypothetical protein